MALALNNLQMVGMPLNKCILNTIKMSDTVLRKIYLSLYLKGLCVRGSWRLNRTATYWPHSYGHQPFFLILLGCSTGGLGPSLSGCWFSLPHLISNSSDPQLQLLNWGPEGSLCCVLAFSTASCLQLVWSPKLTDFLSSLIQPIYGQGYTLLFLDWMHLLFT